MALITLILLKIKSEHPETAGAGDFQDIQDVLRTPGYCYNSHNVQ